MSTAGPNMPRSFERFLSPLAVMLLLLGWEFSARLGIWDIRLTSSPVNVLYQIPNTLLHDNFFYHLYTTLLAFFAGFIAAVAIGVLVGITLGVNSKIRSFVEAPLMALYTAPRLALLPILIVWLGIGIKSKIAVVFLGAVFPIIVNTITGVQTSDKRFLNVARTFNANWKDIFLKILLPGALPSILVGIRLGVGRGVLSVVAAEMFVSQAGMGFQIMNYGLSMQFDKLLVYAIAISLTGYFLTVAVEVIEKKITVGRG